MAGNEVVATIEGWPLPQRRIGHRLRELVLAVHDGLDEAIKWSAPTFSVAATGKIVCSIACHGDHVNLQLFRGADLDDPAGALEGGGKSMRHVKFRDPDEIPEDLVVDLVQQAVALGSESG